MLPALSGMLPDSFGEMTSDGEMSSTANASRVRGPRQHAGGSGQNARAPRSVSLRARNLIPRASRLLLQAADDADERREEGKHDRADNHRQKHDHDWLEHRGECRHRVIDLVVVPPPRYRPRRRKRLQSSKACPATYRFLRPHRSY